MASIASSLRIVPEFDPAEYDELTDIVAGKLDRRLERYDEGQVELELSVKERDTPSQRVVLECWIAVSGRTRFVGTSTRPSLVDAVREACDGVRTQVDRFVSKRGTRRG